MTSSNLPLTVPIDGVIELACAGTHCAALRQDGAVWWWGSLMQVSVPSELGTMAVEFSATPLQISGL